jgi:sirohydrochlorin ferrochelatase
VTTAPVLVLVAHGTARAGARAVIGALTADVRSRLPDVEVRLAHVDVQSPSLSTVMADVRAGGRWAVVVPVLLSAGYHVEVDIAAAVDPARDVVTPTFAGAPELVAIGLERMAMAGRSDLDAIVVAATGSSRAGAREQVAQFARSVASASGHPTTVGWAAAGEPTVAEAVTTAGGRVGVVTYLLAPGVFAARAREAAVRAGAVAVGEPLGPDPRLADVVVARFRDAAPRS